MSAQTRLKVNTDTLLAKQEKITADWPTVPPTMKAAALREGQPGQTMSAAVRLDDVPAESSRDAPGAPDTPPGGSAGGGGVGTGGMRRDGAGGQNQIKEMRRDPNLSPEEDLDKENRPWTESLIGARRRKGPQEGKEST